MRSPILPNGWLEARRAEAAQRRGARGLGFLDSRGEDYYYEDEWGWHYWDSYGNGYWGDWGGGYADTFGNSSGWWADDNSDLWNTLDWWANLDRTITIETDAPHLPPSWPGAVNYDPYPWLRGGLPSYRDVTGDLDYQASDYGDLLPGYCPAGTYHPVGDPHACVPFPPNDPNAKKRANQQQQAAQQAAQQARKQQQQQDQQCPKDPQGRPVWRNPQTGKCELAPQCPQGSKFDSTTKRCLTPAQFKAAYGDNSWLWWLLGSGAALLLLTRDNGGRRR